MKKIELLKAGRTVPIISGRHCIHSLFLALEDQYTRTPPYYVFAMYQPHKGARHVPLRHRADDLAVPVPQGTARMPALSASASVREDRVTLTLTNPSLDGPLRTRVRAAGGRRPVEARATVLTHGDMRGRNTFENPDEVRPTSLAVAVSGDAVALQLPKHSVASVEIRVI